MFLRDGESTMKEIFLSSSFILLLIAQFSFTQQDLAGDWQGILDAGAQKLRLVLHIEKDAAGAWAAKLHSLDQSATIPVDSVDLQGSSIKFAINIVNGNFEGEMSADGASIKGTWKQFGPPVPLTLNRAAKDTAWKIDESTHRVQFITVEKDIRLEVLDWGGARKTLILLAGFGNDAHIFDKIAPKLATSYHVYGITRRGFGNSSAPSSGYSPDRLGDDILAVIHALKLDRPVLVGHSIAGEELSNVAWRHPEMVSGLVYLDAAHSYSHWIKEPPAGTPQLWAAIMMEISGSENKYTETTLPVLAIYPEPSPNNPEELKKVAPSARVVRLPNADHFVFLSNEADVLREIRAFIDSQINYRPQKH